MRGGSTRMIRPRASCKGGGAERIAPLKGASAIRSSPQAPIMAAEWQRRAAAWSAAHGISACLWLGPDLDPLPEPIAPAAATNPGAAAGGCQLASPEPQKDRP